MKSHSMSHPMTWAEVRLDRIAHNIHAIRRRLPESCKFMAVVKADGYGHGAVRVAGAALRAGAEELAVSSLAEGIRLRQNGIDAPILTLSPILASDADAAAEYEIAVPVFQASWLREMRALRTSMRTLRVHLKMDTGMGRIGIRSEDEFAEMVPLLCASDVLVEGVYTHFATANQSSRGYYMEQVHRFAEMKQWVAKAGFAGVTAHCANSAAAMQYPEHAMDMVRVGASLFGIQTCDLDAARHLDVDLQPTLSLHSTLVQVKLARCGERIGYDNSYVAVSDEWIGTVPLGYADGCFRDYRGLSLYIQGEPAPIVGNVCMDQLMLRLPRPYPVGTKVILIGDGTDGGNSLTDLAAHIGTIPQQVLLLLSDRVPRIYVETRERAAVYSA